MLKKISIMVCLLLPLLKTTYAQTDTILNRYKQYLLATEKPAGEMRQLAAALNSNQQWNDINYQDTEKANWKPLIHLKRVRDLALAWANPKSSLYHEQTIWKAINAALHHWFQNRYKSSNWWHNEIGVPQYMRDVIILTKDQLTLQDLTEALKILAQHRVQYDGVGANLTWSADLGFHYAALTNNKELMRKCRDLLLKEIRITTEEGVQPDFSFHQHGKRLQMYQYGKAFLWENVRLAWQLRGTEFAFPTAKINILTSFVLNGWQWMARGIHTVPGTMDRSASRVDALQSADLRKLIPYLIELSPEQVLQFKAMNSIQNGKSTLEGYHYFPYADFAAYHQKGFSFFLKTISTRTLATESINNENLKGALLNSGDAYLIRDGKEYFNLMPVWDWGHLPGVTAFKGANKLNKKSFTGAVSDGKSGLSVMDYQLNGKEQEQLSARKFWASHGDVTVCLMADVKTDQLHTAVYTTLDQCRWRGKVTLSQSAHVLTEGVHQLQNVQWIHHAGFAYIPLGSSVIDLKLGTVAGSWSSINASLSADLVTAKLFMPVLRHDWGKSTSTGYVLSLCNTPQAAQQLVKNPTWEIIRNDAACQAVRFKDGTIMIAFISAGTVAFGNKNEMKVDQPCLVMMAKGKIYASNPAQRAINVNLTWQNQNISLKLKEDGTTSVNVMPTQGKP
jgi:chondroitin AC lyase